MAWAKPKTTSRAAATNPRNSLRAGSGDFTPWGAWDPERARGPRSRTHAFVSRLVERRRMRPMLVPHDFYDEIAASSQREAFPNIERWKGCTNWLAAPATTAVERCLVTGARELIPDPCGVVEPVSDEIRALVESCSARSFPAAIETASPEDLDMALPEWG